MSSTLVIQSHRSPLPYPWLERCLDSVRYWCKLNEYDYHFISNELFDNVPEDVKVKLKSQRVILTDLARLTVLKKALQKGYITTVWLDADFIIFDPENFVLPDTSYAVGREVWVQYGVHNKLKIYKKVHNAILMFRQGNSFLDFYMETAENLIRKNEGSMPPQFIGPKLLTALHNVAHFPVMESAGMLSPWVIKDMVQGGGEALQWFLRQSPAAISGANLCTSSIEKHELSCVEMESVIDVLLDNGLSV